MSSLLWTANLTQYIYSILGLKIFILIYLYVVNCYQRILLVEGFFFLVAVRADLHSLIL